MASDTPSTMEALKHTNAIVQHSKLLQLPSELRNRIYELVLISPFAIHASTSTEDYRASLLRTCRQINIEATEICYGGNKFFFMVGIFAFASWVKRIGALNRTQLRVVDLLSPIAKYHTSSKIKYLKAAYADLTVKGLEVSPTAVRAFTYGQYWNMTELQELLNRERVGKITTLDLSEVQAMKKDRAVLIQEARLYGLMRVASQ